MELNNDTETVTEGIVLMNSSGQYVVYHAVPGHGADKCNIEFTNNLNKATCFNNGFVGTNRKHKDELEKAAQFLIRVKRRSVVTTEITEVKNIG